MAITETTLNGFFKKRYEKSLRDLVPEVTDLAMSIPFETSLRTGDTYQADVRVKRSHGVTFGGSTASVHTLNAVRSGETAGVSVKGYLAYMREQIAYGVLLRAKSSEQAFGSAFDITVNDVKNSFAFYRELNLLYGGSDIGVITAGGLGAVTSATITITEASFAPGVWSQLEGAAVDVYSAPGGTLRNTTQAIVIGAVNQSTREVAITGAAADLNAITANDVIIPYLADTNWFDGMFKMVPNTTASVHGISATSYGLWKGNSYDAGGATLTFAKVMDAVAVLAGRGATGKLTLRVSPATWSDLLTDQAALRRYVGKEGKLDLGAKSIEFYGHTGPVEIKVHPMIKQGYALLTQDANFKRIGSSDIAWSTSTKGDQEYFLHDLEGYTGKELRLLWDQALVTLRPANNCLISGIVNSAA